MTELIKSLEIKGFRGLYELTVPAFGKVNLITGKNNSGKSSLLEAVRMFASRGSRNTIYRVLNLREEVARNPKQEDDVAEIDLMPFRNLFSGFSGFDVPPASFEINVSGKGGISNLSVCAGWALPVKSEERGAFEYEILKPDQFGDENAIPVFKIISGDKSRIIPVEMISRAVLSPVYIRKEQVRCIFLSPYFSRKTGHFSEFWDRISLTSLKAEVIKALQLVSPEIEDVDMVGDGNSMGRSQIAKVKIRDVDTPVPLRTLGDGVNRLFGIILSLCSVKGGILLIDEFETGLHYSVQELIWKTIFRVAGDLNVQVFATTHSWDCVRAFQKAATESPYDGMLIRLEKSGNYNDFTYFDERELEVVTENEIEVR